MKTVSEILRETFFYSFWLVLSSNPSDIARRHYIKRPKVSFYKTTGFSGKHFITKGVSI